MSEPRADLHMHTTFSDGVLAPRELVVRAKSAGLHVISVTDHDEIRGAIAAGKVGAELGVEVVAGVELSTYVDSLELHILGYFVEVENPALTEFLVLLREERLVRAGRIVDRLRALGVDISLERVLEEAGEGSVGRPHVASAVIGAGYAGSLQEVFSKYLGHGCPAYVEKFRCSPEEVFSVLSGAGGLSFLAHPGGSLPDGVVLRLIKAGLDGIETVHPSHSAETVAHFRGIVSEYYLLESGGSDFHGGRRRDDAALGQFTIPLSMVDTMRRRLFVE